MSEGQVSGEECTTFSLAYFPQGTPEKNFVIDLKHIFVTYKKCPSLLMMLTDCFDKSSNPFYASLSIAYNSFDYSQSKPSSLAYTVIETFGSWIESNMEAHRHQLTNNIKMNAFNLASGQKNRATTLLIVKTYELKESKLQFVDSLRQVIANHQYKEACELVKILNLEDNFSIHDFLVPLFLQDKLNIVDEYLSDNTDYLIQFLKFLDSLIVAPSLSNQIAAIISDLKMPDVPPKILSKLGNIKALSRYIKRLISQYNISKEHVPNYSKRSECKTVSYLVHKRFSEKALSDESFRELVVDLVHNNTEVAKELVWKLSSFGAYSEALYWCQVLDISQSHIPLAVQQYQENITNGAKLTEVEWKEEDWEELNAEDYHILSLPQSAIHFISDESHLLSVLDLVLQSGNSLPSTQIKPPSYTNMFKYGWNKSTTSHCDSPCDKVELQTSSDQISNQGEQSNKASKPKNVSSEIDQQTQSLTEKPVDDKLAVSRENSHHSGKSLLTTSGASLISGAASLVSGGASIVSGGVSLMSGTASLVCSGASVVSDGANLVATGVSLAAGRSSLLSAGTSLVAGGASLMSGGSSLVTSGVSLVSGTASVVSGGVNLVSGGASLVSGAASLVAGGVARVATNNTLRRADTSGQRPTYPLIINGVQLSPLDNSLVGPGGCSIVALDCEWKPTVAQGKTELSVFQLATPESVYILDMISLTSCRQYWDRLVSNLFNNQDILKIGFSMQSDMAHLSSYFDCDYLNFGCNLLDLADLWSKLITDYNFQFPFSDDSQDHSNSLSRLVYLCLGKNLDKKERFSNWELRPLRESQIQYAALDAFCLMEIYNVLKQLCITRGLPFDDIVNEVVQKYSEKLHKKKKRREDGGRREKEVQVLNADPINVNEVSLVCDKVDTALAKKLRRCGIDTRTVDIKMSMQEVVEDALKDNKVILSKGNLINKLKENLPPHLVYKIQSWNPDSQFIEVLNYFNFTIRNEDIFSRCLDCNSGEMLRCSREDVESWHKTPLQVVTSAPKFMPAGLEEPSQADYDDFYDDYDDSDDYMSPMSEPPMPEPVLKPVSTRLGAHIKSNVPVKILREVNWFHLCEACGKIYWNEGQFDQILGTLDVSYVSPSDYLIH